MIHSVPKQPVYRRGCGTSKYYVLIAAFFFFQYMHLQELCEVLRRKEVNVGLLLLFYF